MDQLTKTIRANVVIKKDQFNTACGSLFLRGKVNLTFFFLEDTDMVVRGPVLVQGMRRIIGEASYMCRIDIDVSQKHLFTFSSLSGKQVYNDSLSHLQPMQKDLPDTEGFHLPQ